MLHDSLSMTDSLRVDTAQSPSKLRSRNGYRQRHTHFQGPVRDSKMFGAVLSALIHVPRTRSLQIYAEMHASQTDSVCDALVLNAMSVGAVFDAPQSMITTSLTGASLRAKF